MDAETEDYHALLSSIEAKGAARKREYDAFLDSMQTSDPLSKAEAWLLFVADHIETTWDQEALVYLRSRGRECHDQITKLSEAWKEAELATLDDYCARLGEKRSGINLAETSSPLLLNFWGSAPLGDHTLAATMLRSVDCCGISGFDPWWDRLSRECEEELLRGAMPDPIAAAYWFFYMVRSDYAVERMPGILSGYLKSLSLGGPNKRPPWAFEDDAGPTGMDQQMPYASAIVFGHHRLPSANSDRAVIREAVEMLCKHQQNGAWGTWSADDKPSINATAIALHAIALARPRGWKRVALAARDWLWSVQNPQGFWSESGSGGIVHLTVLVLDAIALANDQQQLTFGRLEASTEFTHTKNAQVSARRGRNKPPSPDASTWQEIEIEFVNEHSVRIHRGGDVKNLTYTEFGFDDRRTGKPKKAWTVLQALATMGGTLERAPEGSRDWHTVEKRFQELRKELRRHFGIQADPIPFESGVGYRSLLKLRLGPSYQA